MDMWKLQIANLNRVPPPVPEQPDYHRGLAAMHGMAESIAAENREAIEDVLRQRGTARVTEIAGATGLHHRTVGKHLKMMADEDVAERVSASHQSPYRYVGG